MTKVRVILRNGEAFEFLVPSKEVAAAIIKSSKYDGMMQIAVLGDNPIASWLGSECVAIVVQDSGK